MNSGLFIPLYLFFAFILDGLVHAVSISFYHFIVISRECRLWVKILPLYVIDVKKFRFLGVELFLVSALSSARYSEFTMISLLSLAKSVMSRLLYMIPNSLPVKATPSPPLRARFIRRIFPQHASPRTCRFRAIFASFIFTASTHTLF